jgi:polyhydroxyalkanoate synthesis regulator protein
MGSFIREQEKLRHEAAQSFGIAAVKALEEIARQNIEVFQQTVATIKASCSSNASHEGEGSVICA